jgi:hypothetical protein
MHVDPMNIVQVTLYSKLVTESLAQLPTNDIRYIFIIMTMLSLYKLINSRSIKDYIYEYFQKILEDKNECVIIVPQHNRKIITHVFSTTKESTQSLYSIRFHALNHYIFKHCSKFISKKIEVLKKEQKSAWDNETIDYILLPMQNEKLLLNQQIGIYFQINITNEEESRDTDKKNNSTCQNSKNYVYKISKSGKENYALLDEFMDKCVKEYEDDVLNKKEQQIFEYIKSEKDEDGRSSMVYRSCPFKSNKHLEKNIFFENRAEFIKYIDRFSKTISTIDRKTTEELYEDAGITYKAGIIMHGPPGCGKSSTIRGVLNRTGRHGVIIRWSTIKTCSDLCSLLRSTTINNVKYQMRDLCFIFEDFDANHDDVLKMRKPNDSAKPTPFEFSNEDQISDIPTDVNELKVEFMKSKKIIENMGTMLLTANQKKDDELTLDCVLNVIDGIIELHDAMLIFTTNHLENIDSAFTRPGRIDYILELKLATVATIREMIHYKFRRVINDFSEYQEYFDNMKDFTLSPANIQVTLLKYKSDNAEDCRECLKELVEKMQLI